jgi:hypothetical protein
MADDVARLAGETLQNPTVQRETRDIGGTWVILGTAAIFILAVIGLVAAFWIFGAIETRQSELDPTPLPLIQLRPTPPLPRLQPNPIDGNTPQEDIDELRAREDEALNSYGWVDREAGTVRIPIDKAIDLVLEEIETDEPAE